MSNSESLVFYVLSFLASAALFHIGQRTKRKVFTIFAILIPVLIGGLRYNVGVDYEAYREIVTTAANERSIFFIRYPGIEPAISLFGYLPWQAFFVITSFLTILFFYLGFCRFKTKHIGLCMLLVMMIMYPQALGTIRQGVSMAVCFFAFSFIPERRLWPFLLSIAFATLFHYSSLVMLLVYPLYYFAVQTPTTDRKFVVRLITLIAIFVAAVVVGFRFLEYIPILGKYATYASENTMLEYGEFLTSHNILPELAATAFIVMFYNHLVRNNKMGRFMMTCIFMMMVITLTGFFVPFASRLSDYFMPFFFLAFTAAIDTFKDTRSQNFMIAAVVAYCLLFFYAGIYLNGSGEIFPYRTLFELTGFLRA